jgi:sugar/nucleoside kinase (ribokinase family)
MIDSLNYEQRSIAMPVDYLLIGHMTADLTPNGRIIGGTVSYAVRTAHAFGLRVGVLTSAARNEPLLDELRPYAEIVEIPADSTSTFENIYTPEGRIQYIRGVAAPLMPGLLPLEWRNAPLVHLAPLTDEVDPAFAEVFDESKTMVTLQGWLRRWDADGRVHFKRWYDPQVLKALDLVVLSVEDIAEAPEMEQELAKAGNHVFLTQAEQGGIHYDHGQPRRYPTPQVEVLNPTGAGDVFAASLLCAWHRLGDLDEAAKVAAVLGAASVTRVGLDSAPTPEEVQAAFEAIKTEE